MLLLLLLFLVGLLVWGVAVEPRLVDQERWSVEIPALPDGWQGQEVAVIGDLQVGMWLDNTDTVERIVRRLVERRPALVLIAGDFVYHPLAEMGGPTDREDFEEEDRAVSASVIEEVTDLVRPLATAGVPTYAVLGNHDYGMQSRRAVRLDWIAGDLEQSLEEAGIRVLRNEAVTVPAAAGGQAAGDSSLLYVAGIGSHYAGYDDVDQALDGVPPGAARLVLMHHPASFEQIRANAAPLVFAGHTHGGQVSVPGMEDWSWMALIQADDVHADGWIDGYGAEGNALYVNRGIGFSIIPIRISAAPEITWIELRQPSERGAPPIRER